ncbi:MAG: hotdog fold domain-containing protein [Nannocystaceae bacterium]
MAKLVVDPQLLNRMWEKLKDKPLGKRIFSRAVGTAAPYTGSIGALVDELRPGYARVHLRDRKRVRNHLNSVHAVALINLGEVTTGLAMMSLVPKGGRGIVTSLSMEYKKKSRGTITCEATATLPEGEGQVDAEVVGTLRDAAGDVVAIARAQWRLDLPG